MQTHTHVFVYIDIYMNWKYTVYYMYIAKILFLYTGNFNHNAMSRSQHNFMFILKYYCFIKKDKSVCNDGILNFFVITSGYEQFWKSEK